MNAIRVFSIVAGALIIAACGGSSSGGFTEGGTGTLAVTAETTQVPANPSGLAPNPDRDFTVQVDVRFTRADGSVVSDGTSVTLSSSSSSRGVVSPINAAQQAGSSATSTTSGGFARFWFTSGAQTGNVTLTASAQNPSGPGTISGSVQMTVVEGEPAPARLEVSGDSTMPANTQGVEIFLGSPFINELTVRYRDADGNPGSVAGGQINVAVSPVTRGAYSTLDDPSTDENEFFILMGSGPVNMTAGVATVFIHSFDRPGPLTVSVTAQDASSGDGFSAEFVIEIEDGAADFLPAQIDYLVSPAPVYIQGSGGATSKSMSVVVSDSGGNPAPNPEGHGASFNNVHLELIAPEGSGARLTGTSADGSVSGTEISVRTVNGVAGFSLNAGTKTGSHRIIATVDRADNNVDNDLTDPFSAETTIQVGDGRLAAIELVSPFSEAIRENRTFLPLRADFSPGFDDQGRIQVPDGTYSLTVTALATDSVGNPVLPGTMLSFGKVDAPLTQTFPQLFVFSGTDGNPEEGGTLFSVLDPGEGFTDDPNQVDDVVEIGDTLAMFGKMVPGNREHEAVRTIASVVDDSTVTVTEPFNPNDGSGNVVDDGHVIPWVIGRSQVGNIDSAATLDSQGKASVELVYPVNHIGRPLVMWAQGSRAGVSGEVTKSVADVEVIVFPGVAPAVLTAVPSAIQGNTTTPVRLCLIDALGAPINNVRISGSISGGDASGSLDSSPMPTSTAEVTGSDGNGCLVTEVSTSNMLPDGDSAIITFRAGAATAEVEVVPPGSGRLLVNPQSINDLSLNPNQIVVQLRLLDGQDNPIGGIQLSGSCDGGDGTLEITAGPGVTDSEGRTTATVLYNMAGCGPGDFPRVGVCEFTTPTGNPTGTFTVVGVDVLTLGVSPAPDCPANGDNGD